MVCMVIIAVYGSECYCCMSIALARLYWLGKFLRFLLSSLLQPFFTTLLVSVDVSQVLASLLDSGRQGLLSLSDPDSGVVLLLVGLVGSLWVTDLRLEVVVLLLDEVSDTGQVGPLSVSVDVHLDDTVNDGFPDLILGRTRSTVEDKVTRIMSAEVLPNARIMFRKECNTTSTPPSPRKSLSGRHS